MINNFTPDSWLHSITNPLSVNCGNVLCLRILLVLDIFLHHTSEVAIMAAETSSLPTHRDVPTRTPPHCVGTGAVELAPPALVRLPRNRSPTSPQRRGERPCPLAQTTTGDVDPTPAVCTSQPPNAKLRTRVACATSVDCYGGWSVITNGTQTTDVSLLDVRYSESLRPCSLRSCAG